MKRHSDATLMGMTKAQLVEYVRMAEHNQEVAEAALAQQAENLKDWQPVKKELREAVDLLHTEYERAKRQPFVQYPLAYALHQTWKQFDKKASRRKS